MSHHPVQNSHHLVYTCLVTRFRPLLLDMRSRRLHDTAWICQLSTLIQTGFIIVHKAELYNYLKHERRQGVAEGFPITLPTSINFPFLPFKAHSLKALITWKQSYVFEPPWKLSGGAHELRIYTYVLHTVLLRSCVVHTRYSACSYERTSAFRKPQGWSNCKNVWQNISFWEIFLLGGG